MDLIEFQKVLSLVLAALPALIELLKTLSSLVASILPQSAAV